MSDRNEVRVSDRDPEMLAIKAVAAALEPLDELARKRVLRWADERFVRGPVIAMSDAAIEGMQKQMDVLNEHAKRLGVSARELVCAFDAVRESEGPDKLPQAEAKLASRTKA